MIRGPVFAFRFGLGLAFILCLGSCQSRSAEPAIAPPPAIAPAATPASPDSTDPDLLAWVWEFPTIETLNQGDPGPHRFPGDPPASPFHLEDLSPEDQTYYRNHAGIYLRKDPPRGGNSPVGFSNCGGPKPPGVPSSS